MARWGCSGEGVEDDSVLLLYVGREGVRGTRLRGRNWPRVREIWGRARSPLTRLNLQFPGSPDNPSFKERQVRCQKLQEIKRR